MKMIRLTCTAHATFRDFPDTDEGCEALEAWREAHESRHGDDEGEACEWESEAR